MSANTFVSAVKLLESYRGRDKVIRTVSYASCLASGLCSRNAELAAKFATVTAELNACRTMLRLFDDLSMLASSLQYGLGKKEKDGVQRILNILSNIVNQAFYPIEHIAWAADKGLISWSAAPWWIASLLAWIISLNLGIMKCLWKLFILEKAQKLAEKKNESPSAASKDIKAKKHSEYISLVQNLSNLGMAVHWLPGNTLWAGKLNNTTVGILGITSSVIGLMKM